MLPSEMISIDGRVGKLDVLARLIFGIIVNLATHENAYDCHSEGRFFQALPSTEIFSGAVGLPRPNRLLLLLAKGNDAWMVMQQLWTAALGAAPDLISIDGRDESARLPRRAVSLESVQLA